MPRITLPIIIGSGVLLLSAGVFFYVGLTTAPLPPPTHQQATASDALNDSSSPVAETASVLLGAHTPPEPQTGDNPSSLPEKKTSPADIARYAHQSFGFSFNYPIDHTVNDFQDETGFMVIVSREDLMQEFQIFITPYAEPELPTADEIREALPARDISNVQYPELLGGVGPAVTFSSRDERLHTAYDVWFAREGWLYQLSTHDSGRDLLMMALNSWRHARPPAP